MIVLYNRVDKLDTILLLLRQQAHRACKLQKVKGQTCTFAPGHASQLKLAKNLHLVKDSWNKDLIIVLGPKTVPAHALLPKEECIASYL